MSSYYTYLISTLPAFQFAMKPPFSFEKFLNLAKRFIPDSDIEILQKLSITGEYVYDGAHPTLKKWQDFDRRLRNELVKARAAHKHIEPFKYLRNYEYPDVSLGHLAVSAHRNPSFLEAEKMLDMERWRILDELSFGHYFDLDFLIVYGLKLLILERWERINSANKTQVLEEVLEV